MAIDAQEMTNQLSGKTEARKQHITSKGLDDKTKNYKKYTTPRGQNRKKASLNREQMQYSLFNAKQKWMVKNKEEGLSEVRLWDRRKFT